MARERSRNAPSEVVEVDVGDGTLRVEVRGTGPPLLLLHGLSANRTTWWRVARRLESRFTLHLPDLLGRGESDAPSEARFRLEDETRRVRLLVEALGVPGCPAAGHSQGAAILLALANSGPRPGALLLVNPVTPWTRGPPDLHLLRTRPLRRASAGLAVRLRRPATRWILERRVLATRRAPEELVARYAAPYADPARADALVRAVADWRPRELLHHLPGRPPPTAVLAGDLDRRIELREARRLAGRLGARLRAVEGAGHALPEERPRVVARELERLSSEADARP